LNTHSEPEGSHKQPELEESRSKGRTSNSNSRESSKSRGSKGRASNPQGESDSEAGTAVGWLCIWEDSFRSSDCSNNGGLYEWPRSTLQRAPKIKASSGAPASPEVVPPKIEQLPGARPGRRRKGQNERKQRRPFPCIAPRFGCRLNLI
jgi:hypothetical protein